MYSKAREDPKSSPLHTLDPFIDEQGLLRVGGRLHRSSLNQSEKTPLIIPGKHHIATLLIRHHHERIHHQGRHFTEGAVRAAGFWIVGGKRRVSSIIHQCVTCRGLRAPLSIQKWPAFQQIVSQQTLPLPTLDWMYLARGVSPHVGREEVCLTARGGL